MAGEHIVRSFDEDLNRLDNMIVEMGGLAEMQLSQAIEAKLADAVEVVPAQAGPDDQVTQERGATRGEAESAAG